MGNADLRRNVELGVVHAGTPGKHPPSAWAVNYGRTTPRQLTGPILDPEEPGGRRYSGSSIPLLIEAAQDVFSEDDAGLAYDAGQWWVRTVVNDVDTDRDVGYDTDRDWVAVPATLPAGFTAVHRRNVFPCCYVDCFPPDFQLASHFQSSRPIYGLVSGAGDGTGVIRTEDDAVQPLSVTTNPATGDEDFPYGPGNVRGSVAVLHWTKALAAPPFVSNAGYHPGYRNCRIVVYCTTLAYAALAAGDGWDGTLHRVVKTGLALVGGRYEKTVDTGPVGTAAAGALIDMPFTITIDVHTSAVFSLGAGYGGGVDLYLSPRVDIPCPWNATSGNTCIPGGIASGTVPGW